METVLKDVDRWQKKKAGFEGEKIVCILFVVQSVMMSRKCKWLLGCRYPEL